MFAALVAAPRPAAPLFGPAQPAGDQLRGARRLVLCPGVEVVLDLWKSDPDVFRPKRFPAPRWHARALCRGMGDELFFRGSTTGPQVPRRSLHEARALCVRCPAIRDCLAHALAHPEPFGVWGGTSGRQRKGLLRDIEAGLLTVGEAVEQCLT